MEQFSCTVQLGRAKYPDFNAQHDWQALLTSVEKDFLKGIYSLS